MLHTNQLQPFFFYFLYFSTNIYPNTFLNKIMFTHLTNLFFSTPRSMQPPSWFQNRDSFPSDVDFFSLRPSPAFPSNPLDNRTPMTNTQMEVLDPNTTNSLFVEDPETKSRLFQMSFDVKDYDPQVTTLYHFYDSLDFNL